MPQSFYNNSDSLLVRLVIRSKCFKTLQFESETTDVILISTTCSLKAASCIIGVLLALPCMCVIVNFDGGCDVNELHNEGGLPSLLSRSP